jgi:Mg2+/Co2+ transporter CorB
MSREFEDYISKIDIRGFVRETSDEVPNMQHVSDILGETQGHLQRITQSEIIFPDFLTLDAYPINQHAFQAMKELNQYHHSHVVSYRWKDHKIYAYMVLSGEKTSRKIQSVFSVSWNVWWDLIKKFLVDAPEKYAVSVDCPNYNILLNYMAQREWY